MKVAQLEEMRGGWFVGDFSPSLMRTKDFEVAVKYYKTGDKEDWHVHRVATEITVIVSGQVRMSGTLYNQHSVIMLEPGEGTDFEAITDAVTAVVKTPSVVGDKYLRGQSC